MSTNPRRLGKYELQTQLGRGGMGEVWKAFDTQLYRYVAIKFLLADIETDADFMARFVREAQAIAALHHPNIVQLYDFHFSSSADSDKTSSYMEMDYVEGSTLAEYMRNTSRIGRFPSTFDIMRLFSSISLAIDYAHQREMIHRDIKPANILLDKRNVSWNPMGEPILTDFGVVKLRGSSNKTLSGVVVGTPNYISPEQARGEPGDERSDLYSLGVGLYEIFAGVPPFQGDNPVATMMEHIHKTPTPPNAINPSIPPLVTEVILHSLAKDPSQRFSSASAMITALAAALNIPTSGNLTSPTQPGARAYHTPIPPQLLPSVTPVLPPWPSGTFSSPQPLVALSQPGPGQIQEPVSNPGIGREQREQVSSGNIPVANSAQIVTPMGNQGGQHTPVMAPTSPTMQPPPVLLSPLTKVKQRKGFRIALIALIGFVLLGAVLGAFLIFSHQSSPTPPAVVGHLVFSLQMPNGNGGVNATDRIQLDLSGIPSPTADKGYYAFLFGNQEGVLYSLGLISLDSHGNFHNSFSGSQNNKEFFSSFVIVEDNVFPKVPQYQDPSSQPGIWLYYANLSQPSSSQTTFNVIDCATTNTSNTTNVCGG